MALPRGRARALGVVVAASTALGCGQIAGIDDYAVGDPRVDNPCDELEVLLANRKCQRVGVPETDCGDWMHSDETGGCEPNMEPHACPDGLLSFPGLNSCSPVSPCGPLTADPKTGAFAVKAGTVPGDGSLERPFASIREALEAVASRSGDVTLQLDGEFHESVRIEQKLLLLGRCAERTTIVGDAGEPAVTLGEKADGAAVTDLAVTGAGSGILVDGAENAVIARVWVHDVNGNGIVFQDDSGPTSGTINKCLVERAQGSAVNAYGASPLTIMLTSLRDTLESDDGRTSGGIYVHPSAILKDAEKPDAVTRSVLSVERSVIERCTDAGILVEGSVATVKDSVVRDIGPDRHGHGRGIVVEPRYLGNVPAQLTVEHSVIARTADIGVSVRNARATLSSTTVRDTGAMLDLERKPGSASCLGNGIRIRWNVRWNVPPSPDTEPHVTISDSLVEGAQEAGIHVEGAWTKIERTIVRGTEPEACAGELGKYGDGIAGYSYPFAPARIDLVATRVEKSARAAVAAFGTPVDARELLSDCNTMGVVRSDAESGGSAAGICGCGNTWNTCSLDDTQALDGSLFGAEQPCVDRDDQVCSYGCMGGWTEDYSGDGSGQLSGVVSWDPDRDDQTTTQTNPVGCFEPSGLPKGRTYRIFYVRPDGYMPGMGHWTSGHRSMASGVRGTAGEINIVTAVKAFTLRPVDAREGLTTFVQVCKLPDGEPVAGETKERCFGRGVEGVTAEIVGLANPALLYFGTGDSGAPTSITSAGVVVFYGLPAGRHRLRLSHSGAKLDCTTDPFGDGWSLGWPTSSPTEFEFTVEPGFAVQPVRVYCSVRP